MLSNSVVVSVRQIANDAKDLCSGDFTYKVFVSLLSGLFFGLPTLSAIVRVFTFSVSCSALSRGIASIPSESLMRRTRNKVSALIARTEHPERRYVLAIDDTFVRKFGTSAENCYWFDHTSGSSKQGRNFLVLVVIDVFTGHVYPIDVTLLKGKKHAEYQPRIELLKERLLLLKSADFGKLTLVADSWFSDKKFFSWLNENSFIFEIEIKTNRKITYLDKKILGSTSEKGKIVYPSASDAALTLKRNTAFSGGAPKQIAGGVVRLFGSSLRLKFACVWNNSDSIKDRPFACYVTNKTKMMPSRVWALSRFRWGIECYFRASKQDFSFDGLPTQSSEAALGLVILGMFLYCNIEIARYDPDAVPLEKKVSLKKYPPISSFVKSLRQANMEATFKRAMILKPMREKVLSHFLGRLDPKRVCLKPRDKIKINETLILQ